MTHSFPRAILHIDADAFFTSVEQALNPALKGRPVVTGKERGIIACASYEAKALGIQRGITLSDAKKLCPTLTILPSDYETYGLYSRRMFNILRTFSPTVEEYSIDEAFADLTGLRRIYHSDYKSIARKIQETIHAELGLTVSAGVSLSKGLAKLCSKFRKPNGLTALPGREIHRFLPLIPLDKVWGFGPNTVNLLTKLGLKTAWDFVTRPEPWASKLLHKPGREIWHELRGHSVMPVTAEEKTSYATIIKSKTFTPPSTDKDFVFARLVQNVETACMKARRYKLRPMMIGVVLRRQDFNHDGLEARLTHATSATMELLPLVRRLFDHIYQPGTEYRATMIVLGRMENDGNTQFDLFENRVRIEQLRKIALAADEINEQFGRRTLQSAATLMADRHIPERREPLPERRSRLLPGETAIRRLAMPQMNVAV